MATSRGGRDSRSAAKQRGEADRAKILGRRVRKDFGAEHGVHEGTAYARACTVRGAVFAELRNRGNHHEEHRRVFLCVD